MRIELLTGMDNVVRFPVERRARPSLELLRDIVPDVREVLQLVESFFCAVPPGSDGDSVIGRAFAGYAGVSVHVS